MIATANNNKIHLFNTHTQKKRESNPLRMSTKARNWSRNYFPFNHSDLKNRIRTRQSLSLITTIIPGFLVVDSNKIKLFIQLLLNS